MVALSARVLCAVSVLHLVKKLAQLVLFPSAFIATIFHLVPHFFPLFPPGEGAVAGNAVFCGEILFFYLFHWGASDLLVYTIRASWFI